MVAILLIGVSFSLLAIWISRLQPRQLAAADSSTINHVKQNALAIHSYHDSFKRLPPAFDKHGLKLAVSVHVHLLPYLEQDNLYKSIVANGDWQVADSAVVPAFCSPSDPSPQDDKGIQNIAANLRVFSDKGVRTSWDRDLPALAGIEPGNGTIPATFTDGTQNTIAFTTKYRECGEGGSRFMAAPNSPFAAFFGQNPATTRADASDPGVTFQLAPSIKQCRPRPLMAQSFRENGIVVGLADGTVRSISANIRPRIWNLVLQPNDGQTRDDEWE